MLCTIGSSGFSRELYSISENETQDSLFIRSLRSHPHVTLEFARRIQRLEIRSSSNNLILIRYEPNTRVNMVGSFDYKWLSLSLGLLSFKASETYRKGNTTQFSVRASFSGKRIWNTNFIQLFSGFYLANPDVADKSWNALKDSFPRRPDLNTVTLFSNLHYCFNPSKFSYRAALWQLDRQEKSAGSFIAGLSYRLTLISSDSNQTLIPPSLYPDFKSEYRIINYRQANFTFHGGYIHTFVYRKYWFLTLYFLPGISLESGYYVPEDHQNRFFRSHVTAASEFRFIVGYNGDRWFGGLSSHSISFSGNQNQGISIDNNFNWSRLFVGYRFGAVNRKNKQSLLGRIGL
jgi:hypothetical protein